jgi:hypothetical protein
LQLNKVAAIFGVQASPHIGAKVSDKIRC